MKLQLSIPILFRLFYNDAVLGNHLFFLFKSKSKSFFYFSYISIWKSDFDIDFDIKI